MDQPATNTNVSVAIICVWGGKHKNPKEDTVLEHGENVDGRDGLIIYTQMGNVCDLVKDKGSFV